MTYFNQKTNNSSTTEIAHKQKRHTPELVTSADPADRARDLLAMFDGVGQINFEKTNELALECVEELLDQWLPDGELKGSEFKACNPTRDDNSIGSFSINIVKGVWGDFSTGDSGGDLISLVAYLEGGITQTAAAKKILECIASGVTQYTPKIRETVKRARSQHDVEVLTPVPPDAKIKTAFFGANLGAPSSTWEYKDAAGQLLFLVHRFDTPTGKQFYPETYCKDGAGHAHWRLKAPPVPRPAYGLDRLTARPDAPVLFVEGEKAADAAQRLFPAFVAVTTMNGAKSPEKSDFTPFSGRRVFIAPDNDEPGHAYKNKLMCLLADVGAEVVGVMRLEQLSQPGEALTVGYDLADAETDGWTSVTLGLLGEKLWEVPIVTPSAPPAHAEKFVTKKDREDDGRKEPILQTTRRFAEEHFQNQLAFTHSQFRAYVDGYWPALDKVVEVDRPILEFLGEKSSPHLINSLVSMLGTAYAVKAELFERRTSKICLNNGTLDPLTGALSKHDANHYLTNKLDAEWNASSTCPIWIQTLSEIFAPDPDRVEKIRLLQEFFGYCLVPMTDMHKFLWMVGGGGNGKSLVLNVLTSLIGRENISFAQIERLQDKFVRAELCGKLVNISSEMSAQATIADGYLKQIVAGDVIEAERKHQPSFSFRPYSRMIGATNELPRLLDHSDGFFRRAMILTFNRQFAESEQDRGREAKLHAELPGILKWAVDGLQQLLNRGHFSMPPSSHTEVNKYRVSSDPLRQFAEECLTQSDQRGDFITPFALHAAYKEWCKAYGYQVVSVNKLTERLKGLNFEQFRTSGTRLWKLKYSEPVDFYLGEIPDATLA